VKVASPRATTRSRRESAKRVRGHREAKPRGDDRAGPRSRARVTVASPALRWTQHGRRTTTRRRWRLEAARLQRIDLRVPSPGDEPRLAGSPRCPPQGRALDEDSNGLGYRARCVPWAHQAARGAISVAWRPETGRGRAVAALYRRECGEELHGRVGQSQPSAPARLGAAEVHTYATKKPAFERIEGSSGGHASCDECRWRSPP
jgi:hypothetical protein